MSFSISVVSMHKVTKRDSSSQGTKVSIKGIIVSRSPESPHVWTSHSWYPVPASPRGVFHCTNKACRFTWHRDGVGAYNIRQKYRGDFGVPHVVAEMAPATGIRYDEKLSSSATDSYNMVSPLAKRTHSTYNCSIKLSFTEMDAGERNAKRRRSAGC